MTIFEFLSYLKTLDIEVRADGDRLRCNAPSAVLTAELQQEISRRKAEIIEFLQAAKMWREPASSLIPLQPAGHRPPFFGVPGHNGDVFCYVPLARHLGHEQPFYGLQPPGTDGKRAPLTKVEELAEHFVNDIRAFQPLGPYYIGGFCLGGITAFEVAQQLQRAGHEVALLALFGSPCPTAMTLPHRARMAAQRSVQRLVRPVKTFLQMPLKEQKNYLFDKVKQRRLEDQKRVAALLHNPYRAQVEQATGKAVQNYTAQPYAGPITVYFPNPESINSDEDRFADWQLLTTGRFDSETGPPDCIVETMLREPCVEIFAEFLRNHIDRVRK